MSFRLLAIAAALFSHTPLTSARPTPAPANRVVLVHGFLETGSTYKTLRKQLEKKGFECLVPHLKPGDGRGGLENLAAGLKRDINARFGPSAPIQIVAFSMGGLVSREYLQNLGGAGRCTRLITISSPHHGTRAAWLYPTRGAEQMRPGSEFLTQLHETERNLGGMPVTSYRTPLDLVILPANSSHWDRAENLEFNVLLHPLMLTDREVLRDVESRLLAAPAPAEPRRKFTR